MNRTTRRSFFATSFATGGALAFGRVAHAAMLRLPVATGFRIFACDWTLGNTCDPAAFELAKRIGFDGVQVDFGWTSDGGPLPLLDVARQDPL